ncbi:MAG: DUF1513 domain-containing protein [Gammaproteobacteria bacterium]|nr:DUF1513 domain-containing protein [Gammaproteobacteria bacterium]
MDRRDFLTRFGLGLAVLPALARETLAAPAGAAGEILIGASWRAPASGSYRAGLLAADPDRSALAIRWSAELPGRAHGLLAGRDGSLLAVAVRPGNWLLRLDAGGRIERQLLLDDATGHRRLNGHVAASADGTRLYTTETDRADDAGWITVRDAASLEPLAEWPTHGYEPHDVVVDAEGHLYVANGGILRAAEDRKRDLDRMDASLVRLHGTSGERLGQWRLSDPRLSLRHMAWSRAAGSTPAQLGIAMQAEHDDPRQRAEAPVLALWDGAALTVPTHAIDAEGYAGDIAPAAEGGFVVSNNSVGRVLLWRPQLPGRLAPIAELQQAYALAGWSDAQQPGGVLISAARGVGFWHPQRSAALLPWPEPMLPDNHWVPMHAA